MLPHTRPSKPPRPAPVAMKTSSPRQHSGQWREQGREQGGGVSYLVHRRPLRVLLSAATLDQAPDVALHGVGAVHVTEG